MNEMNNGAVGVFFSYFRTIVTASQILNGWGRGTTVRTLKTRCWVVTIVSKNKINDILHECTWMTCKKNIAQDAKTKR